MWLIFQKIENYLFLHVPIAMDVKQLKITREEEKHLYQRAQAGNMIYRIVLPARLKV